MMKSLMTMVVEVMTGGGGDGDDDFDDGGGGKGDDGSDSGSDGGGRGESDADFDDGGGGTDDDGGGNGEGEDYERKNSNNISDSNDIVDNYNDNGDNNVSIFNNINNDDISIDNKRPSNKQRKLVMKKLIKQIMIVCVISYFPVLFYLSLFISVIIPF